MIDDNAPVPHHLWRNLNERVKALEGPLPLTDGKIERERIGQLEDALRLILPMAKGYAAAHPVGGNMGKIASAEATLNVPVRAEIEEEEDEGEWDEEGCLTLRPAYYDQPDRVFNALLLTGDAEVTLEEVAAWPSQHRQWAAEWAISLHTAASDNEDVKVPPRPAYIRQRVA